MPIIFQPEAKFLIISYMNIKQGFTLIELLVVVLIIGVLAAIVLPQYQKMVLRSRAAEALINVKAIARAQQAYVLTAGNMTFKFEDLDVTMMNNCTGATCKAGRWLYYLDSAASGVGAYFDAADGPSYDNTKLTIGADFQTDGFYCLPRGNPEWTSLCKSLAGPNSSSGVKNGVFAILW